MAVLRVLTPNELVEFFESESDRTGKLFVPDPPREEKVAKSLIAYATNHSTEEILLKSVTLFIESRSEAVLVFDYALEARAFREKVEIEIASREKFLKTIEATKRRHEQKEKEKIVES
jgi:hypothetical protein